MPDVGDNFWVNLVRIKYLQKLDSNKDTKVIVSDVRFQNEIDMIRQTGGYIIKLSRPVNKNNDDHRIREKY